MSVPNDPTAEPTNNADRLRVTQRICDATAPSVLLRRDPDLVSLEYMLHAGSNERQTYRQLCPSVPADLLQLDCSLDSRGLLAGVVSANGTGFWGKVFAVQYYGALVAQLAVAAKVLMAQVLDNVTLFWKHWKKYRGD
jgi:hypothetical protein